MLIIYYMAALLLMVFHLDTTVGIIFILQILKLKLTTLMCLMANKWRSWHQSPHV